MRSINRLSLLNFCSLTNSIIFLSNKRMVTIIFGFLYVVLHKTLIKSFELKFKKKKGSIYFQEFFIFIYIEKTNRKKIWPRDSLLLLQGRYGNIFKSFHLLLFYLIFQVSKNSKKIIHRHWVRLLFFVSPKFNFRKRLEKNIHLPKRLIYHEHKSRKIIMWNSIWNHATESCCNDKTYRNSDILKKS